MRIANRRPDPNSLHLGSPKDPNDQLSEYKTADNEKVTVMYASGPPCGTDGFHEWNVSRDTVIGIFVVPKNALQFSDLHLDERRFKRTDTAGHGPLYFYYTDEEEGLQYEVTQGLVMMILYSPAAKDKSLHCSARLAQWNGTRDLWDVV
jgi:hypothetical protein